MIPILYDRSETDYTTNGVGRLSDCIRCTVTEERNGIYECEFEYPITGIHYSDIEEGKIVVCTHDNNGDLQPFDIYKRTIPIDGVVTFYAHHISYRLLNVMVKPFTATGIAAAVAGLKANSVTDNPFTFWTDRTTQGSYTIKQPSSLREMLCGTSGSILDVFGSGDYEFDKYTVRLWADRGTDDGVTIRYGKNLIDIERDYDISGTYNAVAPYWQDDERTVTLPEIVVPSPTLINTDKEPWTSDTSANITTGNGEQIYFDYAALKAVPLDLSGDFDEAPTADQLRERALAKMRSGRNWLPDTSIDVEFAALWQTPEYENYAPLQRVSLCDTVRVIFAGADVDVKEKVVKTVYNVLLDAYDEVELGNPKTSLSEVITEQTEDRVAKTYTTKGFLSAALDKATKLITGGFGGHVVFNLNADGEPQEILVMDTDDVTTAVNVIRINKNGIGFSNNGYEGPFNSAWTIDNTLDMSQINVANLSANAITAGTIRGQSGGNSWNLESGDFQTTSDSGRIIRIRGGAIDFYANENNVEYHLAGMFPSGYADQTDGVLLGLTEDAEYFALGRQINASRWQLELLIVSDNFDGYSEPIRLQNKVRANYPIVSTSNIYCGGMVGACQDASAVEYTDIESKYIYLYYNTSNYAGLVVKNGEYTQDLIQYSGSNNKVYYYFAQNVYLTYKDAINCIYLSRDLYHPGNVYTAGNIYCGNLLGAAQTVSESGYSNIGDNLIYLYYNASGYAGVVVKDGTYTQDLIQYSPSDNKVYYRFAPNVFISYDSSNDYIYSSKTIHQPSDEHLKDIKPYNDQYDALLDELEPIVYKWKDRPDGPDHVGIGARKTRQMLEELGLDDSGFVGIEKDEAGNERYSIDYQELSVMLLHAYQRQKKEIDDLKEKLQMIMERLEM